MIKEAKTAPTAKTKTPMKSENWLKRLVKPSVNVPFDFAKIPKPNRFVNSSRNRVEATLKVRVAMVRVVWSFRLLRSLVGKCALFIFLNQSAVFQKNCYVSKLPYAFIMG